MSLDSSFDSGQPIVEVRQLKKSYGGWLPIRRRRRIAALQGVSLQAFPGEVFGLLGPNGAGKTTLIKILLGVVKPSSGSASLFGEPVGSTAARHRVGYLPESLRVDRHHSARTALRYYGQLSRMSPREINRRSDELLELVGLVGRDRESVRRFSKGMYQRLGLAQALMHDPDLLVLDEPTDGLDPVGRTEVRKVIERLRDSGKTIFLNSHILQEVEVVCTRVAILAGGEICGTGTIDELSRQGEAEQVIFEVAPREASGKPLDFDTLLDMPPAAAMDAAPIPGREATFRIAAKLPEQHQVDQAVDRLRAADVSIVRLEVKRPTLEDTFMRLVGNQESDS